MSILDLVEHGPSSGLWNRVMQPNFASIMPQVVGVWCEEAGHDVTFVCYTGLEDLSKELPSDTDVLFIGAFTNAALTASAISSEFRRKGAVTVLGGRRIVRRDGDKSASRLGEAGREGARESDCRCDCEG